MGRVLLLTPPRGRTTPPEPFQLPRLGVPPLGLLYLAAALERSGEEVAVLDCFRHGLDVRELMAGVAAFGPDTIGFTSTTAAFPEVIEAAEALRRERPEIKLVLGGPHASARPAFSLAAGPFDAVVVGEGEEALPLLVRHLRQPSDPSSAGIPGVWLAGGPEGHTPHIPDLAALPAPARTALNLGVYQAPGAIVTSRGCPRGCYFCASARWARGRRLTSLAAVAKELDTISALKGVTSARFLDDTLLWECDRVLDLADLLRDRGLSWTCHGAIPEILSLRKIFPALVKRGLSGVFTGVESGDDAILARTKGTSRQGVLEAMTVLHEAGVQRIEASFIIGHPWDTEATLDRTQDMMQVLRAQGVHVLAGILVPYPGAPVGDFPEKFGLRVRSRDYRLYTGTWALMDTPYLRAERIQERYIEILDELSLDTSHGEQT